MRRQNSLRDTQIYYWVQGVPSQSIEAKSTELILNKSIKKNLGSHIYRKGNIIPNTSTPQSFPPLQLHSELCANERVFFLIPVFA